MRAQERRELASTEPGLLFSLTFYRQLIYSELFSVKGIQTVHKHYAANTPSNKYTQPGKASSYCCVEFGLKLGTLLFVVVAVSYSFLGKNVMGWGHLFIYLYFNDLGLPVPLDKSTTANQYQVLGLGITD